jgi:hypothetical protein
MGTSERLLAYLHRRGIFVVAHAIRVQGPLTERDVTNGLRALQERHPLLRVHLPDARADFVEAGTAPIELRPLVRDNPDHWQRMFEEQLARPLPYGERPLLRVTWLRDVSGQEHDLILGSNHVIVDGGGGAAIYRDLLTACMRSLDGQRLLDERLEMLPPLDELLPRSAGQRKEKRGFEVARIMTIDRAAPVAKRRSRALFRVLDADRTAHLAARARDQGATLTGVICAAALKAARSVESEDREFTLSTNVNLRDLLEPPVSAEHLGSYISSVSTHHRVESATEFWALARETRAAIKAAVDNVDYLPPRRDKFGWFEKLILGFVAPRLRGGRIQALNVTNMGRIHFPTEFGPLTAKAFYAASAQHVLGSSMQVAVHTLGGALFTAFVYADPILLPGRAADFVEAFDAQLRWVLDQTSGPERAGSR